MNDPDGYEIICPNCGSDDIVAVKIEVAIQFPMKKMPSMHIGVGQTKVLQGVKCQGCESVALHSNDIEAAIPELQGKKYVARVENKFYPELN